MNVFRRPTPCGLLMGSLVLAAGGLLAFDVWLSSSVSPPRVALPDFYVYYLAAQIGHGHSWAAMYDPSLFQPAVTPVVGRYLPYLNPPLLAWLVSPLTALPYAAAAVLWLFALGICFGFTWMVASVGSWPARTAQLLAALALLPIFIGLEFGQASVLVVGVVALAWWLIRRGHPELAGVALAFLLLKPQVAFLVPVALMAAGYWRVVVAWLATTLALAGLSFMAVGTQGVAGIRASLALAQGLGGPLQVSVWHVVPTVALAALVAAAGLSFMIVIAYRSRHDGPETPIAVGLLATMLVSPYVNYYDLAALVLAAWLVLRTAPARWRGISLAGLYLPVFLAPLWPVPIVMAECLWLVTLAIRRTPMVRVGTLEHAA